jgi:hypothetical protein
MGGENYGSALAVKDCSFFQCQYLKEKEDMKPKITSKSREQISDLQQNTRAIANPFDRSLTSRSQKDPFKDRQAELVQQFQESREESEGADAEI